MRRVRTSLLAGVAVGVLAGCTATGASAPPTWQPSPTGGAVEGNPGAQLQPILPVPSPSLPPSSSSAGGGQGTVSPGQSSPPSKKDQLVVASHLTSPVGLSLLPDGSALVGERSTGRIVRVQPKPDLPVPTVRTLPGLDTAGDGGLLDLAVSPTYSEDNLIYALVTTPTDNRVVDFTLTGPITPVLTGIPKGATGNTGRLLFGPTGALYVGTGDTGRPSLAANPKSLAGKVLRVNEIGRPNSSNPSHTAVYTSGHHVVDGLCALTGTTTVFEVETGASGHPDDVNVLGAGDTYGWPVATSTDHPPITTMPPGYRAPGGCAVLGTNLWVTSRDGHALMSAPLTGTTEQPIVGKFTPHLTNRYGRLKTVVAAADGALWLTTTNRDGHGKPVSADERVIRWFPSGAGNGGGSKA